MTEKKSGSAIKLIVAAIAGLVVIVGVVAFMNLGSIVKTMAEKVGSETLGVKVAIGSIDIDLQGKSVTVHNISIGNPKGYSKPNAMKIEMVNIGMDSFSKELLVFKDVTVKGSELFLEVNNKGTNLSDIKKNIKPAQKTPAKSSARGQQTPKVILKRFTLSYAVLHPTVTLAGGDLKDVKIPTIMLKGIGEKENGVLAREAIAQIWNAITNKAVDASANAGMLQGMSPEGLKDMSGVVKLPKDIGGDTGGAVDKATQGLKGLFGN